jgi:hypothetical protein
MELISSYFVHQIRLSETVIASFLIHMMRKITMKYLNLLMLSGILFMQPVLAGEVGKTTMPSQDMNQRMEKIQDMGKRMDNEKSINKKQQMMREHMQMMMSMMQDMGGMMGGGQDGMMTGKEGAMGNMMQMRMDMMHKMMAQMLEHMAQLEKKSLHEAVDWSHDER